jgi:glycosyltransferase involved in cell wall biosynthesis
LRLNAVWRSSIRRASFVLCISEFTRQSLLEIFKYDPARAVVTHLGVHGRYRPITDPAHVESVLGRYGVRPPYVLYVGKVQARKNILRLIRAFHMLRGERGIPHKLVLAGKQTFTSSDVVPLVKQLSLEREVVFTGHVPDDELPVFYSAADALAYPSLYEGFGLPVIEAMACDTPVLTSNTTSLPEIGGEAAVLVDPTRIEDIASGLYKLLVDRRFADVLRAKGRERAKLFTWEAAARKTLEVYRLAAESS